MIKKSFIRKYAANAADEFNHQLSRAREAMQLGNNVDYSENEKFRLFDYGVSGDRGWRKHPSIKAYRHFKSKIPQSLKNIFETYTSPSNAIYTADTIIDNTNPNSLVIYPARVAASLQGYNNSDDYIENHVKPILKRREESRYHLTQPYRRLMNFSASFTADQDRDKPTNNPNANFSKQFPPRSLPSAILDVPNLADLTQISIGSNLKNTDLTYNDARYNNFVTSKDDFKNRNMLSNVNDLIQHEVGHPNDFYNGNLAIVTNAMKDFSGVKKSQPNTWFRGNQINPKYLNEDNYFAKPDELANGLKGSINNWRWQNKGLGTPDHERKGFLNLMNMSNEEFEKREGTKNGPYKDQLIRMRNAWPKFKPEVQQRMLEIIPLLVQNKHNKRNYSDYV